VRGDEVEDGKTAVVVVAAAKLLKGKKPKLTITPARSVQKYFFMTQAPLISIRNNVAGQ